MRSSTAATSSAPNPSRTAAASARASPRALSSRAPSAAPWATAAGNATTTVTAAARTASRNTSRKPIGRCHSTARFHIGTTGAHGLRSAHTSARPGSVTCAWTNAGNARHPSRCPSSWARTASSRPGGSERADRDVTATVRPNGLHAFSSSDSTTTSR
ncbi:hypothetical protein [Actinomadura madurae]|uniref:hypothetical protein n=1 Tax=Actinomadura madurae TaxID=1993 RepID=UPI0020D25E85|nr:hypothetical protein [Actinomadura madurae]MCP9966051.1 hypothetical protein [Actinomadura madurae]MCP9978536.1 hypothetical protein [Actinomadura madurae]MCQ0009933.1 hypothetical protein [Actinomadura madurae]